MSGMEERAKQFRTAAESQLKGDALVKEISTLRRFLFRNQEYRFTKSAQMSLYMAVVAHHANTASSESINQEAPIVKLLDDALKMPFTVFTSAQKDKLLALYWGVLGEAAKLDGAASSASLPARTTSLILMDIERGEPSKLVLMHEDGTEYATPVVAPSGDDLALIQDAFDQGREVRVTVRTVGEDDVPTVVDVDVIEDVN